MDRELCTVSNSTFDIDSFTLAAKNGKNICCSAYNLSSDEVILFSPQAFFKGYKAPSSCTLRGFEYSDMREFGFYEYELIVSAESSTFSVTRKRKVSFPLDDSFASVNAIPYRKNDYQFSYKVPVSNLSTAQDLDLATAKAVKDALNAAIEQYETIADISLEIVHDPVDTDYIKWQTTNHVIPGAEGRTGKYIYGMEYTFTKPYKKVRFTLIGSVATFSSDDTPTMTGYILAKGPMTDGSESWGPVIQRDILGSANSSRSGLYVEMQKDIGGRQRTIAIIGDSTIYPEGSYMFGRTMVGGFNLNSGVKGDLTGIGFSMSFDKSKCYVPGNSIELKIEGVPA